MRLDLLSGVRVLAVEQYGAGPFGTQVLSQLGAEVIKVEQPGEGDVSRSVGPVLLGGLPGSSSSVFFQGLNQDKKSITVNLRSEAGQQILRRLAESAHAVVSNLRGDVGRRLGITYGQLSEVNPAIVCAHLTGYGRDGARASRPGYDFLVQAELGFFDLTGDPDGDPARMGVSMIDLFSGVMMALATVSALRRASETGVGDDVDVSLFDVGLYSLNYLAHWYLNGGAETRRLPRSAHASLTPCQLYRTADGWIYLMCNKEKFWPALCSRIGRPDWASEPRYATFADRLKCRDELTQMLDRQLSGRTTGEWLEIFGDAVPAAPLRSLAQALDGAEVAQRGAVEVVPAPGADPLRLLGFPVRAATAGTRSGLAPALGEHTDALLAGLGLTPADIRRLRADGVV